MDSGVGNERMQGRDGRDIILNRNSQPRSLSWIDTLWHFAKKKSRLGRSNIKTINHAMGSEIPQLRGGAHRERQGQSVSRPEQLQYHFGGENGDPRRLGGSGTERDHFRRQGQKVSGPEQLFNYWLNGVERLQSRTYAPLPTCGALVAVAHTGNTEFVYLKLSKSPEYE
jgi:hypothetical protein